MEARAVSPARRRLLLALAFALAGSGVVLTQQLVDSHVLFYAGTASEGALCGGTGVFSCSQIAGHDAAWILGLPVATWGLWYFVLVLWLGLGAILLRPPDRGAFVTCGAILCTCGFLFDIYLGVVMVTSVGQVCVKCVATYALNLGLALSYWQLRRGQVRVSVSAILPSWRCVMRPEGPERYKSLLKAALLGLLVIAEAASIRRELRDLARVRRTGEAQIEEFVARIRNEAADVSMDAFAAYPSVGPPEASIDIVAVLDFKCHFCRQLDKALRGLREKRASDVRVTSVVLPMDSECNDNVAPEVSLAGACWLARAADCAHSQGRFQSYSDHLFDTLHLEALTPESVVEALPEMDLNEELLRACVQSDAASHALAERIAFLESIGIRGTPSLVINGHVRQGTVYGWALERICHTLLEEKAAAPGSPPASDAGR